MKDFIISNGMVLLAFVMCIWAGHGFWSIHFSKINNDHWAAGIQLVALFLFGIGVALKTAK
ncbi:MAG: hypothetical protein JEY79_10995 [Pseudodesulfovibrio sp.]|nr:hypothetical protein [Pseudodesulfovibrio sp.]